MGCNFLGSNVKSEVWNGWKTCAFKSHYSVFTFSLGHCTFLYVFRLSRYMLIFSLDKVGGQELSCVTAITQLQMSEVPLRCLSHCISPWIEPSRAVFQLSLPSWFQQLSWYLLFGKCSVHVLKKRMNASLVAQWGKKPPAVQETQETWVCSQGWEDPLEEEMATHSSILAWRILMDRGAWWATVHWVAKSRTGLSTKWMN